MVLYIFLLLLVGIGLFWILLHTPARKIAAFLANAGPLLVMAAGVLLTLFRLGIIGMPLIFLGLSWWRRSRSPRPIIHPSGRHSTVRSINLEMELDHDTGEMDGNVLTGKFKGARLSALSEDDLLELYLEIQSDVDSAALLESFLDRYHRDWRQRTNRDSFRERQEASGFAGMTRKEAYQILGLEPGASEEEIHQAWRRLIKGVHPDSGGSEFLAAKINAARDALLG